MPTPAAALALYQRANGYLDEGLIRLQVAAGSEQRSRRDWLADFLPRLGHPERTFPAIHVAGTSGKGSIAIMIAEILRAAGVRSGLHVSPYLQLSTEKLWVDGRYASAQELAALVDWIRPHAEACRGPEVPMHGMAWVAVTFEHLRRQGVELGVIEVGVGGRHDLTNVLDTKVAVISSIGLDHLKTLGPTLEDIAWHKAGIIRPGCSAVALEGPGAAAAARQAQQVGAALRVVRQDEFAARQGPEGATLLCYRGQRWQLDGVPLAMAGPFQAQNAALALAALEALDPGGARISEASVIAGLGRARLPGRMELLPVGDHAPCPVLLDGAHNPDKLNAMLGGLSFLPRRRLHVLYGGLASRAPDEALRRLARQATRLVLTEPQVHGKPARPAADIRQAVSSAAGGSVLIEPEPCKALRRVLADAAPQDLVVITGSIYLCGQLREHWYPAAAVLAQRQSWF